MANLTENPAPARPEKAKRPFWYHLHFWIGWVAAIPIAIACVTGTYLVFSREIKNWDLRALYQLEAKGPPPTLNQVLAAYHEAQPSYQVNYMAMPVSPNHAFFAYCTQVTPTGRQTGEVAYDPYTGSFTPITGDSSLTHTVEELHRHLASGKIGQMIVAFSTILLGITCIFGLILWLPLRSRTFTRAWKRGQPLDWHNALGVILLLPLVVMAITGVTDTWKKEIFPFLDKIQGRPSVQAAPVVTPPAGGVKIPIQTVFDQVQAKYADFRITGIQPSNTNKNPYVFIMDADGNNFRVFLDPYTGALLMKMDGSGTGPVGWYRRNHGKFHSFATFGLLPRTIWGLLSFGGAVMVVTGMWISIKRWRRPKRIPA